MLSLCYTAYHLPVFLSLFKYYLVSSLHDPITKRGLTKGCAYFSHFLVHSVRNISTTVNILGTPKYYIHILNIDFFKLHLSSLNSSMQQPCISYNYLLNAKSFIFLSQFHWGPLTQPWRFWNSNNWSWSGWLVLETKCTDLLQPGFLYHHIPCKEWITQKHLR